MHKTQGAKPLLNGPKHYVQVLKFARGALAIVIQVVLTSRECLQIAELGHGTFGMVVKALDIRTVPPTEVAIKMLPRGDFVSTQQVFLESSAICV